MSLHPLPIDFAVAVKLFAIDGTTLIFDMSDEAAGYEVVDVTPADESAARVTTTSPFVNGAFPVSERDDAGAYAVQVRVRGTTWAQVETRRLALRTAYRSAFSYLLDVTLEGVTTRYRASRPNVTGDTITSDNLDGLWRVLLLTFPVQPNPTVTGA